MQDYFREITAGSRFINFLIKIGSSSPLHPEERRRRTAAVFVLLIMMICVSLFSIGHFYGRQYSLLFFDLLTFFASLLILLHIRRREQAPIAYWIIGIGCVCLFAGTTIFGRTEISSFLWAFLVPAISFSILGNKKGLSIALVFFCTAILLMAAPKTIFGSDPYSLPVIVRFSILYLMLTIIIYYYESSQMMLIRSIRQERDKFEKASRNDLLTGLSNRRDIIEKMETERERHLRMGKSFSVILGDIDNFRKLNDSFGHDAGDYVLKIIGQILKNELRGIDCPSRWGGEEFLIMLIETDLDDGQRVAERIRKKIENTNFQHNNIKLPVTMTLGISSYQRSDDHIDDCIKRAGKALYEGKKQGKNKIVVSGE